QRGRWSPTRKPKPGATRASFADLACRENSPSGTKQTRKDTAAIAFRRLDVFFLPSPLGGEEVRPGAFPPVQGRKEARPVSPSHEPSVNPSTGGSKKIPKKFPTGLDNARNRRRTAAVRRARIHLGRRACAEARRLLEDTIARHPQAVQPRLIRSRVLLEQGADETEQALVDVLALDAGNPEARHNLDALRRTN